MESSPENGGTHQASGRTIIHPGLSRHATAPTLGNTVVSSFDAGAPGDTFRLPHRKSPIDTTQILDSAPFKHTRKPTGLRTRFPIRVPSNEYNDLPPHNAGKAPPIPAKSHTRLASRQKSGQTTPQSGTFGHVHSSPRSGSGRDRYGSQNVSQGRLHLTPPTPRLQDLQASDGDVSSSDASMEQSRTRKSIRRVGAFGSRAPVSNLGSIDEGYHLRTNVPGTSSDIDSRQHRQPTITFNGLRRASGEMTVRSLRQTSQTPVVSDRRHADAADDEDDDTKTERPTSNAPALEESSEKMMSLPESCHHLCWALDKIGPPLENLLTYPQIWRHDDRVELGRRVNVAKHRLKELRNNIKQYEKFVIPGERDKSIEIDRLLTNVIQTTKLFKHIMKFISGHAMGLVQRVGDLLARYTTWTMNYVVIELHNAFLILKAIRAATRKGWYGPRRPVEYECTDPSLSYSEQQGAVNRHRETLKTRRYGIPDASRAHFPRTASGRIVYEDCRAAHPSNSPVNGRRGDETRTTSRASTLIGTAPPPVGPFHESDNPLPSLSAAAVLSEHPTRMAAISPINTTVIDEERRFEEIFLKARKTVSYAQEMVPPVIEKLVQRLNAIPPEDRIGFNRKETAVRGHCQFLNQFQQASGMVAKKIATMPLANPSEFSGINFWGLVSSWSTVWMGLLIEFSGEIHAGMVEVDDIDLMSKINRQISQMTKMVEGSPWKDFAKPGANEVANTPIMVKGEGFSSPAVTTPGSTFSDSMMSLNVPPTPLSAALGPAAHATITSNPYSSSPQTPGLPSSILNSNANYHTMQNPPRSARSTTLAGNPMYRGKGSLARTRTTGSHEQNSPSSMIAQLGGSTSADNHSTDEPQYQLGSLRTPNLNGAFRGGFFAREQTLRSVESAGLPAALRSPYAGKEEGRMPLVVKKRRNYGHDGAWDED